MTITHFRGVPVEDLSRKDLLEALEYCCSLLNPMVFEKDPWVPNSRTVNINGKEVEFNPETGL